MTREDVVEAEAYFATWWDEAKEHVPHLADRAHVAMMVVSSPEHIGIMVNVVADAYRDYLEI